MTVKFKETEIEVIGEDDLILGTLKQECFASEWEFDIGETQYERFTADELEVIVKRLRELNK